MSIHFRCHCGSLLIAEPAAQSVLCPVCNEQAPLPIADTADLAETETYLPFSVGETLTIGEPTVLVAHSVVDVSFHRDRQRHVRRLNNMGAIMIVAALAQLIPVFCYPDAGAPPWMRAIVLIAGIEIALAAWMMLVPDWSTLWIATLVAAGVAAFHAFALAVAVATPAAQADVLGIDLLRDRAQLWLTGMLLVSAVICFACGQLSFRWRTDLG